MPPDRAGATILLVEDDEGHARLIEKNLRRSRLQNPILRARNGREALEILERGAGRPDHLLVLLDINMPDMDGYQILERMKRDPRTRRIPVVMLTTTDDRQEIERCYELGCNAYVTKPVDYDQFCHSIQELGQFVGRMEVPA